MPKQNEQASPHKAMLLRVAFGQVAEQYRAEGNERAADTVTKSVAALGDHSLAKLHDILREIWT